MKIMVAYDGTLQAKDALVYGMDKAREKGGEVVAFHVFNSPLFIDYDATPNAEALARAESDRFVEEAKAIIREKGKGVKTSLFTGEGNPDKEIIAFAREEHADILLCPPRYTSIIRKYQKALGASDLVRGAEELDLAVLTVPTKTV
jgi:nucleotide-binding universal stress UspA family protein